MTSNHHAPYDLGSARAHNGVNKGKQSGDAEQIPKNNVPVRTAVCNSTARNLVIASNRGSECRGEYVPGSCTHRPSHHGSQ